MTIEFYVPPAWPGVGAVKPRKSAAATKQAITSALKKVKPGIFGATAPCPLGIQNLANSLFFDTDNGFSVGLCHGLAHSSFQEDRSGYLIGRGRLRWLRREKRRVLSELVSCALVLASRQPADSYVASCADLNQFFEGWAPAVWEKLWTGKSTGPDYVICDSSSGLGDTATFVEVKGRFGSLAWQPAGSTREFSADKAQSMNARFRPEFAPAVTRHALFYATIDPAKRVALQMFNHDFPRLAVPRLPPALPVAFSQFVRQLINAGLEDEAQLLIGPRGSGGMPLAEVNELENRFRRILRGKFLRSDENERFWRHRTTAPSQLLVSDAAVSVFARVRGVLAGSPALDAAKVVEELRALSKPDVFASVAGLVGSSPVGTAIELRNSQRWSQ